ncbi:hypothetical protein [Streptomyces sp. NPDC058620]|uniref:hypothetical protein n=1 Tax=Streptomyces sp. NPDC058620 TaxID=3346560 RepID=UPI00365F9FF7
MTTANPAGSPGRHTGADPAGKRTRRLATETKSALKTTEFFVYIASVIAVLIASMLVGTEDDHGDYFRADKAWLYIVLLTIGYMISRGLAKSGSRDQYDS